MTFNKAALDEALGYRFQDEDLLREALTHASSVAGTDTPTYQRLEFLGDRVLGLVVAEMLHLAYPDADEGELSRRSTKMVRGETCAKVAKALDLGNFVLLGDSERRTGAQHNRGILANVCESIIGAIFLDGGYPAAQVFIAAHWHAMMMEPQRILRDPKTMLQEWAHKAGHGVPSYRTIDRDGPDHEPEFVVEVRAEGLKPEHGRGSSKRAAEQAAAHAVLVRAGVREGDDND